MADIKENSFVGIASMKAPDGTLNALEVLVFPENDARRRRGPLSVGPPARKPDDQRDCRQAWPRRPSGQTLTLKYKDGTQTIKVKPGTPIVTFQPGTKADAKVGAKLL